MVDQLGSHRFEYSGTGQLTSEAGPWANDTVSFTYQQGLRDTLSLLQPSGTPWSQSYDYYPSTRQLQTLTSPAGNFGYHYAPAGTGNAPANLVSGLSLPNGASITNTFDFLSRLKSTALNNSFGRTLDAYTYDYDAANRRKNVRREFANTASTLALDYDALGQLTQAHASETNGVPRYHEQLDYTYDHAHNLHYRTNGGLLQTFTADALNQLQTITRSDTLTVAGTLSRPVTNLTINATNATRYLDNTFATATPLPLADGQNQFTVIAQDPRGARATNTLSANLPASISPTYDANGNLTEDGLRHFQYDQENQLTKVYVPGQWQTEFLYDGLMRKRIERDYTWSNNSWLKTNETRFLYEGNLVLQERDESNQPTVTYTRGLDLSTTFQGAGGIGGLLARTHATTGTAFYHADGSGNITALMDPAQAIAARYLYDPFGRTLASSGPLSQANRYRFSSKELHPNSGLYYYGFRFYEPGFQRWLSRDPIAENGGINLYGFVLNSPLRYVDTYGLKFRFGGATGWYPSGPLGYLDGDSAWENLVAGMYDAIPTILNSPFQISQNIHDAFQPVRNFVSETTRDSALGDGVANFAEFAMLNELGELLLAKPCPPAAEGPIKGSGGPGKVYEIPAEELSANKPYIGKTRQTTVQDRMKAADHRSKTPTGTPPRAIVLAEDLTIEEMDGVEALIIEERGLENLSNKIPGLNTSLPKNQERINAGKKVLGK